METIQSFTDRSLFQFLCRTQNKWGITFWFGDDDSIIQKSQALTTLRQWNENFMKKVEHEAFPKENPPSQGPYLEDFWNPFLSRAFYLLFDSEEECFDFYSQIEPNNPKDGKPPAIWALVVSNEGVITTENV